MKEIMSTSNPRTILCWLDIETTGLTPGVDIILEIAWQFTDLNGEKLSEAQTFLIQHRSHERLIEVLFGTEDTYVRDMHRENGLWKDLIYSQGPPQLLLEEVLDTLLEDVSRISDQYGTDIRLAGRSVHFDRSFLEVEGINTTEVFSHRIYDLSVLRTFYETVMQEPFPQPDRKPGDEHRAVHDVQGDILAYTIALERTRNGLGATS